MIKIIGALALAAMLASCGTMQNDPATAVPEASAGLSAGAGISSLRADVIDIAEEDLAWALADAEQHEDEIAARCYRHIQAVLPELKERAQQTPPKGIFSAFQWSRDRIKRVQAGASDAFILNCSPLYVDARRDLRGIAGLIARVGAALGVRVALPL